MFNLQSVLSMLPVVGPVVAAAPQFKAVFDGIVSTFGAKDQATLKSAYADIIADNNEGHARLQGKLAEAAKKR